MTATRCDSVLHDILHDIPGLAQHSSSWSCTATATHFYRDQLAHAYLARCFVHRLTLEHVPEEVAKIGYAIITESEYIVHSIMNS